ncbi:MAG: HAMP domain-containing protein, partial [Clostridiales bacterium]|nr:HAMP domain-containing protein [Clostridiales bacterium]
MSKRKEGQSNKPVKAKRVRRGYRARKMSIFLMLWAVFSALSLFIVLLFGISQHTITTTTYKQETSRLLREQSAQIKADVLRELEEQKTPTPSLSVMRLSVVYDVDIKVLSLDGEVILPQKTQEGEVQKDYTEEVSVLREKLQENVDVVYEGEGEYVYGSKINLYGHDMYLYISKSFAVTQAVASRLALRTVIMSLFTFVLSFAISGVISGWVTRPVIEMQGKANALAHGDFTVDFHGDDYAQEIFELAEELNYARDELAKTDAMQKELIANVSHDFKTPLTMIKAYASMIMEISGDIPEKRNKHAQVIVDEADRLTTLVSDVLELSKIRSGLERLHDTVFDMSTYVKEIISRFQYLVETHGYQFSIKVEKGLYTRGDETLLGQVLYNLIGNAVNYTGEDKRVEIVLKKTSDTVFRFMVKDTGAGIKQEDVSTIWDRYYRSSETHKRPVKGTGLGLSIVKTVLERHRFVFGVDS